MMLAPQVFASPVSRLTAKRSEWLCRASHPFHQRLSTKRGAQCSPLCTVAARVWREARTYRVSHRSSPASPSVFHRVRHRTVSCRRCRSPFPSTDSLLFGQPRGILGFVCSFLAPSCYRSVATVSLKKENSTSFPVPTDGSTGLSTRLSRADRCSSIFFCNPPPDYPISLHGGYKVQAALCVDRLPLVYEEPPYEIRWREFKAEWEAKTHNGLQLSDEITFMKFPFHFFETEQIQKQKEELISKTGDAEVSELELLLSQEGFSGTRAVKLDKRQEAEQGVSSGSSSYVFRYRYQTSVGWAHVGCYRAC